MELFWLVFRKLEDAWHQTIDACASAFSSKQTAIDISAPVNFDNPEQVVDDVLSYGYQKVGAGFFVQGNWLVAKTNPDFVCFRLVKDYSSKTTVGFQMLWFITVDATNRKTAALCKRLSKTV